MAGIARVSKTLEFCEQSVKESAQKAVENYVLWVGALKRDFPINFVCKITRNSIFVANFVNF